MEDQSRIQERRNAVRLDASCPCTYTRFDDQGNPIDQRPSKSIDLSRKGVRLQSSYPVESGEVVKIIMALGEKLVNFRGKVVHVTRSKEQGFELGIFIEEMENEARVALNRFVIKK